jgi:type II secretory pathway component PulF
VLTYKYTARDTATGQRVKSEVQAENEQSAAKLIMGEGLSPIDIVLSSGDRRGVGKFLNKVPTKDKVLFSRQLSTLLDAGLPLIQSLRSVNDQTTNKPLKVVISKVIASIEAGSSLSASLAPHPRVFNQIYVSLVQAGETSGTLDKALERLANQQEKDAEIISKVRGALIYPAIVIVVMGAVLAFMIVKVLPQVEVLYKGIQGAQLPLLTRIMLIISHAITKYWWIAILLAGFLGFFTSKLAATLGGKRILDRLKMRAWPIGPLFMKMYMARFARTATTLVASGVPLIQVLDITSNAVNNVHIAKSLTTAIEKVRGGKALSDAIAKDPNFLPLVPNMLKIGEQSGAIEKMLDKTADYYEREVDNEVKAISTIIEPVLMVLLGIMAFIIVAAVLLPIYGLAGKTIIK